MARVTQAEVLEIIDTSESDISVFIDTANLLVTNWLGSSSLDDDTLKEIEKYLSAHVLSVKDMRIKSARIDDLDVDYQGKWDLGLNNTNYGQMAILLDTTGTLSQLARKGKRTASFGVIGYHGD